MKKSLPKKPPQAKREASPSPSEGGDVFPTTCLLKFKAQNHDYFSIAGVTMIVINTLACTLITRYLLYALVWKRTSPPLEGLGEASFWRLLGGRLFFHLSTYYPLFRWNRCFLKIRSLRERGNHAHESSYFYTIFNIILDRNSHFPIFEKNVFYPPNISFPTQTLYFSTQKNLLFCAKIFLCTKTYLYCTKNLIFPPVFSP